MQQVMKPEIGHGAGSAEATPPRIYRKWLRPGTVRKGERASFAAGNASQHRQRLAVQPDRPGPRLAVRQREVRGAELFPTQIPNFADAGAGEQK